MSVAVGSVRTMSTVRRLRPVWADATPDPAGRPVQLSLEDVGTPLSDVTFVVVDLETTGGTRRGLRDHRDRRGQGARRRGPRRVPDAGGPGRPDPALHPGADRHHRRDGRRRPADRAGAARLPRVLPAAPCSSRTTRRSTSASSRPPARETGHAWPGDPVVDTVRLARRVVTRDEVPNCKLGDPRRATSAPRRRPTTGRWPTPGPPSTCCTGSSSGSARSASRTSRSSPPRQTAGRRRTRGASAPGRRPAGRRRASTCSAGPATRCCTSARRNDLRTRVRSYFTSAEKRSRMTEMVAARRSRVDADPVRHAARGARPRAAADRRAHAPLQPPLPVPGARAVGPAHRRAVPAAVRRPRGHGRGRRRLPRAVLLAPAARAAVAALHETLPAPPVHAAAPAASPGRRRACVLAEMGRCGAPCTGHQSVADVRGTSSAASGTRCSRTPDPWSTPLADRIDRLAAQERFEEAATRPRPARRVPARRGARRSGSRRSPRAPSSSPPGRTTTAGGSSCSCAAAGSRRRRASTAGADPRPTIADAAGDRRAGRAAVAPATAAHPEETELVLRVAGEARRAAGRASTSPGRARAVRGAGDPRRRRACRPRLATARDGRIASGAAADAPRAARLAEAGLTSPSTRGSSRQPPAAHGMMPSMLTAIVLIDSDAARSPRSPRRSPTSTASARSTPSPARST